MKPKDNSPSVFAVITTIILCFSTICIIILVMQFTFNYKIIKHEKDFKKIKVKIDSSKSSTSKGGTRSTYFYFNKGSFLRPHNGSGFGLKHQSHEIEINEYMAKHHDSVYIWYLDRGTSKFAYEDQKNIVISQEIENNQTIKIYFLIYIVFLVLVIKLRYTFKSNVTTKD